LSLGGVMAPPHLSQENPNPSHGAQDKVFFLFDTHLVSNSQLLVWGAWATDKLRLAEWMVADALLGETARAEDATTHAAVVSPVQQQAKRLGTALALSTLHHNHIRHTICQSHMQACLKHGTCSVLLRLESNACGAPAGRWSVRCASLCCTCQATWPPPAHRPLRPSEAPPPIARPCL